MAEPMSVKLSGVDGVYRVSDLGQKKILKKEIDFFFKVLKVRQQERENIQTSQPDMVTPGLSGF